MSLFQLNNYFDVLRTFVYMYVCISVCSYPNEMEQFVWQLFNVISSDEDLQ